MKIVLNDESVDVDDGISVADLLTTLGIPDKGIAVAVDWAVIPRSNWHRELADGAKVKVVTAVQGG
ncbi:sulfur carrier protein ThiS [Mycolicibacterium sp. P1-18]|uniref:sulfur carrier protein ThiS n=1 Tax=Mycolicibacterium sp. P1-18 TaxID=2024615 RepID=UPI0011F0B126|nr:sulfur carrier protein ThiS [Mycolicibacterium sp. P1-18]KAA0102031.1 sulfur carrier protein ThiS [Mycolicibacterium sp. P1-18]